MANMMGMQIPSENPAFGMCKRLFNLTYEHDWTGEAFVAFGASWPDANLWHRMINGNIQ